KNVKEYVGNKIERTWQNLFSQYQIACQNNQELLASYRYVKDYENVVNFDFDKQFEITVGDSECREQVYCAALYNDYFDAYANIDKYRREINGKLVKLDAKRFVLGKKIRRIYLESKLKNLENEANEFGDWLKKAHQKEEYLVKRSMTYQLEKNKFKQLEVKIANQIIFKDLKNSAVLACKQERPELCASFQVDGTEYQVDNHALYEVCCNLRQQVLGDDKTQDNKCI
ncbi:MAG: hypothetical protein J5598_01135, partial [Clostridia bacterium]|nr:hypothetical protein [Clostridia bacterium]